MIYRSRMSARQCLEHRWMAQHAEAMSRIALPTEKLKKFIVRRKWQVRIAFSYCEETRSRAISVFSRYLACTLHSLTIYFIASLC